MQVPFYGHVRQYQSIKDEIDAKLQEVIMSGQYVQGPMLKQFEQELAAYAGTKYAIQERVIVAVPFEAAWARSPAGFHFLLLISSAA